MGDPDLLVAQTYVHLDSGEEGEPWLEVLLLVQVDPASREWIVRIPYSDGLLQALAIFPFADVKIGDAERNLPERLGGEYGQPIYRFRQRFGANRMPRLLALGRAEA